MSERRDTDVIVHLNGQRSSKALRCVGLALPSERLGQLTHIGIEDTLETVNPRGCQFLKLALVNHIGIALKVGGEFRGVELLVAIGHTGIHLVGYHTVVLPHIVHVIGSTALSKVNGTIHADVLDSLVQVAVIDNKALAQVNLLARFAQNLALKESVGRVAPACSRLVLVLDRSSLDNLEIGELESRAIGDDDFVVGHGIERKAHCQNSNQQMFHLV